VTTSQLLHIQWLKIYRLNKTNTKWLIRVELKLVTQTGHGNNRNTNNKTKAVV